MRIFQRALVIVLAVLMAGGGLFYINSNDTVAQEASGSGLRISPTRSELTIDPGSNSEITQVVKNVTANALNVQPTLTDFESNGVTGDPVLISDPENISINSLREFISLPDPFELGPEEEVELRITLNVPDNASPGAYFGSILYRASPTNVRESGQVALVASVGSLILLEVPGDIVEQISILGVSAYLDSNSGSLFTKIPDEIGVNIENLGNGFSRPFGSVTVKDWRGNNIFTYELNDVSSLRTVLPNSKRLFLNELFNTEVKTVNDIQVVEKTSPIKWPGKYKITANVSHGSSGEVFTTVVSFWYIPSWIIISSLVLLLVLIGISYYMYKKYTSRSTRRRR